MITAGVDAGLENTKIVIIKDGGIAGSGICLSGGAKRAAAIDALWEETLAEAGLSASDIDNVAATGQGKRDARFAAKRPTEVIADARAARFFFQGAATVVDIGADQTRVVTLDGDGGIREIALNQKCMAGLGLLLEIVAGRLGMSLDEMSGLPRAGINEVLVNDGCPVFAEQGALELLNSGAAKETVARAVIEAVAVRLNSILNDKERPKKDATVLVGGVAGNRALVSALRERSGVDFIVPEYAIYGGALGAALIAAEAGAPGA